MHSPSERMHVDSSVREYIIHSANDMTEMLFAENFRRMGIHIHHDTPRVPKKEKIIDFDAGHAQNCKIEVDLQEPIGGQTVVFNRRPMYIPPPLKAFINDVEDSPREKGNNIVDNSSDFLIVPTTVAPQPQFLSDHIPSICGPVAHSVKAAVGLNAERIVTDSVQRVSEVCGPLEGFDLIGGKQQESHPKIDYISILKKMSCLFKKVTSKRIRFIVPIECLLRKQMRYSDSPELVFYLVRRRRSLSGDSSTVLGYLLYLCDLTAVVLMMTDLWTTRVDVDAYSHVPRGCRNDNGVYPVKVVDFEQQSPVKVRYKRGVALILDTTDVIRLVVLINREHDCQQLQSYDTERSRVLSRLYVVSKTGISPCDDSLLSQPLDSIWCIPVRCVPYVYDIQVSQARSMIIKICRFFEGYSGISVEETSFDCQNPSDVAYTVPGLSPKKNLDKYHHLLTQIVRYISPSYSFLKFVFYRECIRKRVILSWTHAHDDHSCCDCDLEALVLDRMMIRVLRRSDDRSKSDMEMMFDLFLRVQRFGRLFLSDGSLMCDIFFIARAHIAFNAACSLSGYTSPIFDKG